VPDVHLSVRKQVIVARNQPKVIVLTGATRGLGLALVEKFIELGHTVLGCGRSREGIENLRRKFRPPHEFAAVDVAQESLVEPWAARLLSSHGAPDLLINNAGVINQNTPLWQVPGDEFDRVIDVNVKGVANVIRHFVPAMVARKAGVIVNFSSGWGRSVAADVAPYCASKWAIEGLTLALAEELPRPMSAIPLNPGIIDTDMLRSCFGGTASRYPSPTKWVEKAAPFILALNSRDNGKPLTIG
jgi:NAD(P)-dependent dehydrogenase (short-subunit alcohol dehydrogenase family)